MRADVLVRPFIIAVLMLQWASLAPAREWTSSNGKFKIEAEFVALKDGKVVLEKPDGSFLSVAINQISKADIEFIEKQLGKKIDPFAADAGKPANPDSAPSSNAGAAADGVKPRMIKLKGSKEGDPPGPVRDFGNQGWGIKSLAFSGDGAVLVAGKADDMVAIFDVNQGSRKNLTDRLNAVGTIEAIAVSRDGKRVVAGGYKGLVKVWNMSPEGALKEGATFAGHSGGIASLAISPDGRFALSGSKDKSARYWQVDTGKEFEVFPDFKREVKSVWISEDGTKGLACDGEMLGRIDLAEKKAVMTRVLDSSSPQFVAFSPDGKYLAMNDSYNIRIWDLATNNECPPLKSNEIQWTGAFTPDSARMVSGGNGIINVWDVKSQKRVGVLTLQDIGYVQTMAVSPDNEHMAAHCGSAGGNLKVFRLPPP